MAVEGEEVGFRVGRVAGNLRDLRFERVDGPVELDGDLVRVGLRGGRQGLRTSLVLIVFRCGIKPGVGTGAELCDKMAGCAGADVEAFTESFG